MDFTLEEVESILEEMGFKNIPHSQLEDFSKGSLFEINLLDFISMYV